MNAASKEGKTAHTRGPWRLSASVFVGDSPFPAVLDALGLVVCDVLDDGKSEAETLANALLIAAAPDLLEAATLLEKAEEFHSNCDECLENGIEVPEQCPNCLPLFDDARVKRRAAIARAKKTATPSTEPATAAPLPGVTT